MITLPAKKLIESALPLREINEASAKEKSIRHEHPSTLHLWWARRPLATARAVLWSSLIDDPSEHPEKFPTPDSQDKERNKLFDIIKKFVQWENFYDPEILNEARKELGDNLPEFLDPFSGGGSIPLEAQRLGLTVHAHDLNPVAVLINKSMLEIPPRFADCPAVNPDSQKNLFGKSFGSGTQGLSDDVNFYGQRLKSLAFDKIGSLYPQIMTPEGQANIIAWIWARTVKCPNPACNCEMPLVNSFVLSSKAGHEAFIDPEIKDGEIFYHVKQGRVKDEGTVNRSGAKCICCGSLVNFDYIREEGKSHRIGTRLIAIIAEGNKGRIYLSPTQEHEQLANVPEPENCPDSNLPEHALGFRVQLYGFSKHKDLFTNRQLTMLTTFSELLDDIQDEVKRDAINSNMHDDNIALKDGGRGAHAYSEAVRVYLAFVIDKLADYNSTVCTWNSPGEKMRNTFTRQAIPMTWDIAESNPFCNSSGSFDNMLEWVTENISRFPANIESEAKQFDAVKDCNLRNVMISTDPPYYDNIGYADLSDYFYIWLRKNLRKVYPDLFAVMTTPKNEELIATPYRHDNKDEAKNFFESGMLEACKKIYLYASDDYPVTIYYAYKQKDSDSPSSGWETMLSAIINAGFVITGTWPMRTELMNRSVAMNSNALASSIVLVCRKRPENAHSISRREFMRELHKELESALKTLQASSIAPVDMTQSAIGPGMAVYSRYSSVLESDGKAITIREALQIINDERDKILHPDNINLDAESKFCIELYTMKGFDTISYGEADTLSRAKNVTVDSLVKKGVLFASGGKVHLTDREKLPSNADLNITWALTQKLTHAMSTGGNEECANIIKNLGSAERAKDLAYRLYNIAEHRKWNQESYAYNALVSSWPEIVKKAAKLNEKSPFVQKEINFQEGEQVNE